MNWKPTKKEYKAALEFIKYRTGDGNLELALKVLAAVYKPTESESLLIKKKDLNEEDVIKENVESALRVSFSLKKNLVRVRTLNEIPLQPYNKHIRPEMTRGFDSKAINFDIEYKFDHYNNFYNAKVIYSYHYH